MFGLLLSFWRGDGRLPDEPEAPADPQEQTPETAQPDDGGQTIVEYAIILVWLTLAFIGLIGMVGGGTQRIWATANSNLSRANVIAKGN